MTAMEVPQMPRPLPRVSLVCVLSELEAARFHKLLGGMLATPGMKSKHLGEVIIQTLEVVLPGEDVRGKMANKLIAIYMERDFKPEDERWRKIDPGPPDA
jgi:hypothetical protein